MDDQHMVNTWDALSQITGVTAISNDGTQSQFHARGAALANEPGHVVSPLRLKDTSVSSRGEIDRTFLKFRSDNAQFRVARADHR